MLVRQLEEELRMRMRQPNIEMQQQMEAIYAENEHLTREIAILRDTIKVCWSILVPIPPFAIFTTITIYHKIDCCDRDEMQKGGTTENAKT